MESPSVSVLSETRFLLGEGLHWDDERMVLWMVDIHGQQLVELNLTTKSLERHRVPEAIGWVLPVQNTRWLLLGLASGIAAIEGADDKRTPVWVDRTFPGGKGLRLNDAKVDGLGRLWAGSMSVTEEHSSAGVLARFSVEKAEWEVIDTGYAVPNGPAFNSDGSVMLHSDSPRGLVYRFDLHPVTGSVVQRSVWQSFPTSVGFPDGMTFDAEGLVWIAHWGQGQVRRYRLSGQLDRVIDFPTLNVTNVCFGGPQMDRLFVSSARYGLKNPDPLAGSLFEIMDHGTRGFPQNPVPEMAILRTRQTGYP